MPETDFFDADEPTSEAPAPAPEPPKAEEVPVGAETVTVDGEEHSVEEVVAAANRPGPNLVEDEEVVEAEAVEETVKVQLVEDAPVDEAYISVPGIDPDADYVEVTELDLVDSNEEAYKASVARVKVTQSVVELPVAVGNLVGETPYAEVVH